MIVKDEETLQDALQMLETSPRGVRFVDTYAFRIITTPENLEYQCRRALKRWDIVVVVPLGSESAMEDQSKARRGFSEARQREQRRIARNG